MKEMNHRFRFIIYNVEYNHWFSKHFIIYFCFLLIQIYYIFLFILFLGKMFQENEGELKGVVKVHFKIS